MKGVKRRSKHVRRRHGDRQVGQLRVEALGDLQRENEIRVHVDLPADAGAGEELPGGILVKDDVLSGRDSGFLVVQPVFPRDGRDVIERVDHQVEMLVEQIELQDFRAELEVAPGVAGRHDAVVLVAADGVAAAQSFVLLVLVDEVGDLVQVVPRHLSPERVLEAQVIGEGKAAEHDGHEVAEMAHELGIVVLREGNVPVSVHIEFAVDAPVRNPFHVPAVIGQADASFQVLPAQGLVGMDQAGPPVVSVQRFLVVVVLEVEMVDVDTAEHGARHDIQFPENGLLDGGGGPEYPPVVRIEGRPGVLVEVQFGEIGRMEPVEPVEVVHRRVAERERPRHTGPSDECLGIEQPVQVPGPLRRPSPAHRDMVLEVRVIRTVSIIEEIAEPAEVQPDVRIVTHVRERREHPPRLRLLLRRCSEGGG